MVLVQIDLFFLFCEHFTAVSQSFSNLFRQRRVEYKKPSQLEDLPVDECLKLLNENTPQHATAKISQRLFVRLVAMFQCLHGIVKTDNNCNVSISYPVFCTVMSVMIACSLTLSLGGSIFGDILQPLIIAGS